MRKSEKNTEQKPKRRRATRAQRAPKPVGVQSRPLDSNRPAVSEGLYTYQSRPIRDIPPGDKVQLPVGHSIRVDTPVVVVATETLERLGWSLEKPKRLDGYHRNLMVVLRNTTNKALTIEPDTHVAMLLQESVYRALGIEPSQVRAK